ncbi:MAG: HAD-IC family P-type ATPase, partial [Nitriliruptoraceae bacterium]
MATGTSGGGDDSGSTDEGPAAHSDADIGRAARSDADVGRAARSDADVGRAASGDAGIWYGMPTDEVLAELVTGDDGLSQQEAERRLEHHGPNRIRESERVSAWRILLGQFTSPLIYVLLAALVVTVTIQSWADVIVIGAVLVINSTIGFVQEYRAESAVQSLMEMVSPEATVVRGGERRTIDAEELVPGDLVEVRQGSIIPADVRLMEVESLQVNEAALTGESVPVDKLTSRIEDDEHLPPAEQTNMGFMGTAVTSGNGRAVVVATGAGTKIGEIAEQVEEAEESETPLQLRIDRLARFIAAAILGVAAVAFVGGVLAGRDVFDMLLLGVALAVAAIPAGLPIVVTVALAIGVQRMTQRQAVIRNLHAVDTLGSCSTIVSDKTGTLTQNQMTVRAVLAGGRRYDVTAERQDREQQDANAPVIAREGTEVAADEDPLLEEVLLAGVLCNDVEIPEDGDVESLSGGDPMEVALIVAAARAGLSPIEMRAAYPRRGTVPFRTEQRYMATIHEHPDGGEPLVVVKGAPERVLGMCDRQRATDAEEEPLDADAASARSESLAAEGLRVLAVAAGRGEDLAGAVTSDDPHGMTFIGMHGLLDPPRASAVEAVGRCHDAGIRVVVVTGDHATTAAAIGRQIGVGGWRGSEVGTSSETEASGAATSQTAASQTTASQAATSQTAASQTTASGASASGGGASGAATLEGKRLAELSDEDLDRRLAEVDVYARVTPDQKLRLVERLKAADQVVAVTGDGVNDAPALEAAHIGAAMGSGTDVAKEASDMVVTDDDFASVYAAVEEGRTAFRNVRVATFFLLSTGLADVLIILSALLLGWPLPLLPAQILWVNVVTNGIADVALAFEPGEKALFRRPPRPKSEGVLDRTLIERLVIVGIWLAIGTLGVFWWSWEVRGDDVDLARTIAVTTLVLFQKVHVFNCRSEDVSIFRKSLLSNKLLFAGVMTSLAVHVGALYWSV